MQIHQDSLTSEVKDIITNGLRDHAIERCGVSQIGEPVSFYYRDQQGNIISAIVVHPIWGALHIKYLWTSKPHRNQGHATKLMEHAIEFAKQNNLLFAYIETFHYQALNYYQKLGFTIDFARKGYANDAIFYYLSKPFN